MGTENQQRGAGGGQEAPPGDEQVGKLSGIIPEFYMDIVCRVIPGGLIMGLWFPDAIAKAVSGVKSEWVYVPCLFFAAWTVGTVFEVATYAALMSLVKRARGWWPQCFEGAGGGTGRDPGGRPAERVGWTKRLVAEVCALLTDEPELILELPIYERRLMLRRMAEMILFRVLAIIALFVAVCPPAGNLIKQNVVVGATGWCVFSICWYSVRRAHVADSRRRRESASGLDREAGSRKGAG